MQSSMRGPRGGTESLDKTKNIGFLSNTGPDPLKITKLNFGPLLARRRNPI